MEIEYNFEVAAKFFKVFGLLVMSV